MRIGENGRLFRTCFLSERLVKTAVYPVLVFVSENWGGKRPFAHACFVNENWGGKRPHGGFHRRRIGWMKGRMMWD